MDDLHRRADVAQINVMMTVIANEAAHLCGERYDNDDRHNGRYMR